MERSKISSRLVHHGASATSSSKGVVCLPKTHRNDSAVVYASEAVLNIATQKSVEIGGRIETLWNVDETLCTSTTASQSLNSTVSTLTAKRVISSISIVKNRSPADEVNPRIVCGFSDGTINLWEEETSTWHESVIHAPDDKTSSARAITDIAGIQDEEQGLNIIACSSQGATWFRHENGSTTTQKELIHHSCNVVRYHLTSSNCLVAVIGSALPKHNKIHVIVDDRASMRYCGHLIGHEDWITSFDWIRYDSVDHLASGSQDAKIRLWKFTPTATSGTAAEIHVLESDSDYDDGDSKDEEVEEGESRLVVFSDGHETSVTLEALLVGHEERVTGVSWHPDPQEIYGQALVLISSSMDRSILIWCEIDGIWTPISRVGTAGGILGGSIGSSLLGFLNVILEPCKGNWMLGHGYGGALHFFSCRKGYNDKEGRDMTVEERAALSPWRARPCITGHFGAVTDMSWEANDGSYLMTVGTDQTCRIWTAVPAKGSNQEEKIWIEIARPQVHGYNLASVTSVSTSDRRHLFVSAADEKELRVFDATRNFVSLMETIVGVGGLDDPASRVERAYIPSLGLSNKATAAEGAEEDTNGVLENSTQLPLERDLGAISLWPEKAKLFGHNTELIRLISTSAVPSESKNKSDRLHRDVLVASAAKARNAEDACIRLWSIAEKRCVQVLRDGHRSTVTALAFSPDASILVSSGKDRRICVWERASPDSSQEGTAREEFSLILSLDACHKRIVWDASFCTNNNTLFATASRDGTIKMWNVKDDRSTLDQLCSFNPTCDMVDGKPVPVTSVAFAPYTQEKQALMAIGLENGRIELWSFPIDLNIGDITAQPILCLPVHTCHLGSITRLAWRPEKDLSKKIMYLASCSADHGCRIHEVCLSEDGD